MLENWFEPVSNEIVKSSFTHTQTGAQVKMYQKKMPSLRLAKLAIVGVEPVASNAIRQALYSLESHFPKIKIVDLGNLRNRHVAFSIQVIQELHRMQICPILIGADESFLEAQYHGLLAVLPSLNLSWIDSHIPLQLESPLSAILKSEKSKLHYASFIGFQSHYVPLATLVEIEQFAFDSASLGQVREQASDMEPLVRYADLLGFNMRVVRASDYTANASPCPNGLFLEEACQIARYAGMSDKLSSFGLYGYEMSYDGVQQLGAHAAAQVLWYFLEGVSHRKQDFPLSTDGLVEYVVPISATDETVTFWKSQKSGRWWMQIPVTKVLQSSSETRHRNIQNRHRLIPCSYSDYQKACEDDLPQRLLNAINRF